MLARRLLFLVAALMMVSFIASAMAPRPDSDIPPTPAPQTGGAEGPAADVVRRTLDAGAGEPRSVRIAPGDTLELTVEGDEADGVELVGLDYMRFIEPETPALFEVRVERDGEFPIMLTQSERMIGRIVVRPR